MKTKYTAVITAVVLAAAATLFAVEKQAAISPAKLIHLKSNGATIAELKLPKGTTFEFTSMESTQAAGQIIAKGGVTLQIKHAGGSAVTVKADEIVISDAK
jgi:lipopolysaccharide assembly outer membrane protein LptD (OstA)